MQGAVSVEALRRERLERTGSRARAGRSRAVAVLGGVRSGRRQRDLRVRSVRHGGTALPLRQGSVPRVRNRQSADPGCMSPARHRTDRGDLGAAWRRAGEIQARVPPVRRADGSKSMRIIRVAFAHTVTIPGAALNNVSEDSKEATSLRWVVSEPNLGTGLLFIDKRGM